MNRDILKTALLVTVTLTTTINAGGKVVTPAQTPVTPIPVIPVKISPWYIGSGITWAKLSGCNSVTEIGNVVEECTYEDETYGTTIRGGYEMNKYFGIEARAMRTFLDEGPYGGTPLESIGIYAKPQYPMSERINLYGLLGYGYTENLGNGARLDYFDNDSGFSAGVGLEYDLSDRDANKESLNIGDKIGWSLFLDYQRLLIKSDIPDLDAVSFGLRYDFK
jgi:OOP family OmpA-OmpF porin